MVTSNRGRKRIKKSGVIYFAVNNRIPNMVKIGMTVDSSEIRLNLANRKNEFMCGRWVITQKVKTNDVQRTEALSHKIFQKYRDLESVSTEMFFIPENMTVKQMADIVREKDQILLTQIEKQNVAKIELERARATLKAVESETEIMIALRNEES